jgi:MFS family permease
MPQTTPKSLLQSGAFALGVLAFINLFNYLDRFVVAAVFESLKRDGLARTDANLGALMSAFLIVYTLAAPVFGALGDTRSRPRLIAVGVGLWSIATVLSGFAGSLFALLAARAVVGIGEASYGTVAPSLLSDYFPAAQRSRVMAIFFCAIPVGSALGYVVGGAIDQHLGWRSAFFVAGTPGLLLAGLCLLLRDPPRGAQDAGAVSGPAPTATAAATSSLGAKTLATYGRLLGNRPYVLTVLGYAAYTFAVGGLGAWMPSFLERVRGIPKVEATVSFGAIVVVTGFVGTFVGGWLGDYAVRRSREALLKLSGVATLLAAPLVYAALTTESHGGYLAYMVGAQFLIFLSTGPINAAIVNLVSPLERASAVALSVFSIHLLGDCTSPYLIGRISDATSLQTAVLIVPIAVLVSGLLWTWAAGAQRLTSAAPGVPAA